MSGAHVGKKKSYRLLTVMDIIAPLGVTVIAVVLGFLGFYNADIWPARIISLCVPGVFVAFTLLWFWLRYELVRADYITIHGLRVVLGRINTPGRPLVESWINELVAKWIAQPFMYEGQKITLKSTHILSAINGCRAFFLDKEKLSAAGRAVRGYAWGSMFVVGYRKKAPEEYLRSLFYHECSHCILGWCGFSWDEKTHHVIFKDMGIS